MPGARRGLAGSERLLTGPGRAAATRVRRIVLAALALALAGWLAPARADDDKAYCAELSSLYRKYVQGSPGRQRNAEAATAIYDCSNGNTAAAIPVLERILRESGFTLPNEAKP